MKAECVVQSADVLGECPVWSLARQQLFWLDLSEPRLHRFDPAEGSHQSRALAGPAPLGGLSATDHPQRLVLGRAHGVVILDTETLVEVPLADAPRDRAVHYNDAGVDRAGRLWMATAESTELEPRASLVRVAAEGIETADDGFIVANGPVFSAGGDRMFASDSLGRRIVAYDLDPSGRVAGKRTIATFDESMGYPDGLAVDVDCGLWVAHWGGAQISRWTFDGEMTDQIEVPIPNVTSVAFGGVRMDRLFITTAADEAGVGGDLFAVSPGVAGVPETPFAVSNR